MATTVTTRTGIRLAADMRHYVNGPKCGQLALDIFAPMGISKLTESSLPVDRRVKPANLLASFTARPTQFRELIEYPVTRTSSSDWWMEYETNGGRIAGRIYQNNGLNFGTITGYYTTPTTDWGLRLRGQIAETAVNLGDTLVEYRETCKLFHDAAMKLVEVVRTIRRPTRILRTKRGRRVRKPLGLTRKMASAQLLADFGITPLVSVLYDSLEVLNGRKEVPIFRCFSGQAKQTEEGSKDATRLSGKWDRSQRYRCYVRFYPNSSSFTAGNPLAGAWELVPWSWLIDQFVNVGKYLQALDALDNVGAAYGYVTTLDRISETFTNPSHVTVKPGRRLYTAVTRDLITKDSIPLPLPRWKPSNSWKAALHATEALISSRR